VRKMGIEVEREVAKQARGREGKEDQF